MKDGGKVDIDLIMANPDYEERRSEWTAGMYLLLKDTIVRKAGMIRILVEKSEDGYIVVAGHQLLKAARDCGFREVCVDIVDGRSKEELLPHFEKLVEECCQKSRAGANRLRAGGGRPSRCPAPSIAGPARSLKRYQTTR
ncbi:MAG: hypothetical protein A4E57_00652 [Syntrophorhabdaceae bacterium PtaU1.Bin034]|nr:MAG: hypothetical protein A4E57_00652 [Syntrophorhabdaceae bacterium PtaU1.Bin034]